MAGTNKDLKSLKFGQKSAIEYRCGGKTAHFHDEDEVRAHLTKCGPVDLEFDKYFKIPIYVKDGGMKWVLSRYNFEELAL